MGDKKGFIILGMHRSGTSALTRVLNIMGVHLGDQLLAASKANPKGFWEDKEIVLLNDKLMHSADSSWRTIEPIDYSKIDYSILEESKQAVLDYFDRTYSGREFWGMKDPRICRLITFYHDLILKSGSEPIYVLTLRHPIEVINSLEKRDNMPRLKAAMLWLMYALESERNTRNSRRSFTSFDALMEDWEVVVSKIESDLEIQFPAKIEDVREEISGFLDKGLRHSDFRDAKNQSLIERISTFVYKRLLLCDKSSCPTFLLNVIYFGLCFLVPGMLNVWRVFKRGNKANF